MFLLLAAATMTAPQTNWVSADEARQGFVALPISRWHAWKKATTPSGWRIEGQDLVVGGSGEGGDLESMDQYVNFDLRLDWNISEGGNSGVIYRSTEAYDDCWETGPEYQLLDNDRNGDGRNPLTSAGSAYAVYPPTSNVCHPAGQWNAARIVVKGHHVEHWLNGVKVVEYDLQSPDWTERVSKSKFSGFPRYGMEPVGHIVLQDHGYPARFRNIRIKRL
jgi:hypothetical protein